ncbi:GTP 3',8-cyclase MoaA [Nocardia sp. NPDC060259]|uniref:GTP 3',8-cyclase MoaA n=1 Tax=Nocardia sp. NPDC060259 TaxID=3347088 RepID=UPI00364C4A08
MTHRTMLGMPQPGGPDRSARLIDRFGRVAKDLRVSLTDRCNLRCTYCMPAEGLRWLPTDELLSTSELQRLMRIAVEHLGIEEIRFTGGEPLLRADLTALVGFAAELTPRPRLSLTTNGLGLARKADGLARAGLDRINVSLDSIDPATYATMTRRDRLADVLDGLSAARNAALNPIKINAVLVRGVNDHQAPDLLRYCLAEGYELRIIEQMPLDAGRRWQRSAMVTAEEVLTLLQRRYTLTPDPHPRHHDPAERWLVDGGPGTIGLIASVTRPFCGDCDRVRLTADGMLRNCLFATDETDLRPLLREQDHGGEFADEAIADAWRRSLWNKAAGHGIDHAGFAQPDRPMSAIGG